MATDADSDEEEEDEVSPSVIEGDDFELVLPSGYLSILFSYIWELVLRNVLCTGACTRGRSERTSPPPHQIKKKNCGILSFTTSPPIYRKTPDISACITFSYELFYVK